MEIYIEKNPPKGCKLDLSRSNSDKIVFKKTIKDPNYVKNPKTINGIYLALFYKFKKYFNARGKGHIFQYSFKEGCTDFDTCYSEKQCKKLMAFNKLLNVAKYFNGDKVPKWKDYTQEKYNLYIKEDGKIGINRTNMQSSGPIFLSKEGAEQAIKIVGEKETKLALCSDY